MTVFFDFETQPIESHLPPAPVGLAIRHYNISRYYAFGHPSGNNCTEEEAREELAQHWGKHPLCGHNTRFDYGVAVHHWGMSPYVNPELFHDTLALASLKPSLIHVPSVSLKNLARLELKRATTGEEELHRYIQNQFGVKSNFGAHIAACPGDVVEPYAIDDVDLTFLLFANLLQWAGTEAYKQYQHAMPIVYEMEQRGIEVDSDRMIEYKKEINTHIADATDTIRELVDMPDLNINSGPKLLDALIRTKYADTNKLKCTPTGKYSSSKDSIDAAVSDPKMSEAINAYRHASKIKSGFIKPWEEKLATFRNLHPSYRYLHATKTGRMTSSNPNALQVPPEARRFLVPPQDYMWGCCDYSQQELRILAQLSQDEDLLEIFRSGQDLHQVVADAQGITRKAAKALNFGIIYGAGPKRIAAELNTSVSEARKLLDSYFNQFKAAKWWIDETIDRANKGLTCETLGGRELLAQTVEDDYEPQSKILLGYKMPNMVIQGSGADMTMAALIDVHEKVTGVQIMTVVYDEIDFAFKAEAQALEVRNVMAAAGQKLMPDVPVVVDIEMGWNWGELL